MCRLERILKNLLRASKKSRAWRTFVSCLAAIVVFVTTYSLILPAITVEKSATEDVVGLVMEEADPGSTGAGTETPEEAVIVEAEYEIPDEIVQEKTSDDVVPEEIPDETTQEETFAPNGRTNPAGSASSSAGSASSSAGSASSSAESATSSAGNATSSAENASSSTGNASSPAENASSSTGNASSPAENASSVNGPNQPAESQTGTAAQAAESTTAEEVKELKNGEVQTVGDRRIMILTGEDYDVVVSGNLSAGVSDGTVLSVRRVSGADTAGTYSERISDELLRNYVVRKTTEVLYQLVFTDENLVEYTPAGSFDVQFIFHNNTVSHTGERVYAVIYDSFTDEMLLVEKNSDEYETPVITFDENGFITGITLKGLDFEEYSDILALVAGPVNEDLKLAAEKAADSAATDRKPESGAESAESGSKAEGDAESGDNGSRTESSTESAESGSRTEDSTESAESGSKSESSTESAESGSRTGGSTESAESGSKSESSTNSTDSETGRTEKTESVDEKTDPAESKAKGPSAKAQTSRGIALKAADSQTDGVWDLADTNNTKSLHVSADASVTSTEQERDAAFRLTFTYSLTEDVVHAIDTYDKPFSLVYDLSSTIADSPLEIRNNKNGVISIGSRRLGTYTIVDGKVTLHFTDLSYFDGRAAFTGYFRLTAQTNELELGEDDEYTYTFPGTSDSVTIPYKDKVEYGNKSMRFEQDADGSYTLHYTADIDVNSNLDQLIFNDTIGGLQTLDPSSVKIGGRSVSVTQTETGFTFDVAGALGTTGVAKGSYQVTYDTKLTADQLMAMTADKTTETNTVSWNVNGSKDVPGGETSKEFEKPKEPIPVVKTISSTANQPGDVVNYTITFGKDTTELSGFHISDVMTDVVIPQGKVMLTYNGQSQEIDFGPQSADASYSKGSVTLFDYTFPEGTAGNGPVIATYSVQLIDADTAQVNGVYDTTEVSNIATEHRQNTNDTKKTTVTYDKEPEYTVTKSETSNKTEDGKWAPGTEIHYTLTIGDADTNMSGVNIMDLMTDLQVLQGDVMIKVGNGSTKRLTDYAADAMKWFDDGHYSPYDVELFNFNMPSNAGYGPVVITYTTKVISQDQASSAGIHGDQVIRNTGTGGKESDGTTGIGEFRELPVTKDVTQNGASVNGQTVEMGSIVHYTLTYGEAGMDLANVVIEDYMTDLQKLAGEITIKKSDGTTFTMPQGTGQYSENGNNWIFWDDGRYNIDNPGNRICLFKYRLPNDIGEGPINVEYDAQIISEAEAKESGISGTQSAFNKFIKPETEVKIEFPKEVTHNPQVRKEFDKWDVDTGKVYWNIILEKDEESAYPLENVWVRENTDWNEVKFTSEKQNLWEHNASAAEFDVINAVVTTDDGTILTPGVDYMVDPAAAQFNFPVLNERVHINLSYQAPVKIVDGTWMKNKVRTNGDKTAEAEETYNSPKINMIKNGAYTESDRLIKWEVLLNPSKKEFDDSDPVRVWFSDKIPEGLTLVNYQTKQEENPSIHVRYEEDEEYEGDKLTWFTDFSVTVNSETNTIEKTDIAAHNPYYSGKHYGLNHEKIIITYYTLLSDEEWDAITSSASGSASLENHVDVTAGNNEHFEATDTVTVTSDGYLNKTDTTIEQGGAVFDPETEQYSKNITYKVEINPNGYLLNKGQDLSLTDYIATNMDLDPVSVVLKYAHKDGDELVADGDAEGIVVSYNDDARLLHLQNIPDSTPLLLTYTCIARAQGSDTFTNTATLIGGGSHSSTDSKEHKIQVDEAGVAVEGINVSLLKIDENNVTKTLEGAQFQLYECALAIGDLTEKNQQYWDDLLAKMNRITAGGGTEEEIAAIKSEFAITNRVEVGAPQTSRENGRIPGWEGLSEHKLYAWREVTSPENYTGSTEYHYFVGYQHLDVNTENPGETTRLPEEEQTNRKHAAWALDDAAQLANDIRVASVANFTSWTATNVESKYTSISATKKWEGDSDNRFRTRPIGGIRLQLVQINADGSRENAGNPVAINADENGNWPTYIWNMLPSKDKDGGELKYTVLEERVDGYTTEYSDGGEGITVGEITVTNKMIPKNTNIYVEKAFDQEGNEKPGEIHIMLMIIRTDMEGNAGEPEEYMEYMLNEANGWKHVFEKLPTKEVDGEGNAYYLTYTVIEDLAAVERQGFKYSVSYSDNGEGVLETTEEEPLLITNKAPRSGSLKISKKVKVNGQDPTAETYSLVNGTYTFTIAKKDDAEFALRTIELTIDGKSIAESEEITDLPAGIYVITESAKAGTELIEVTVDNTSAPISSRSVEVEVVAGKVAREAPVVSFTNNVTKIDFEKIWMNNNASTKWAEDTSITVTVSGGNRAFTYTISRSDLIAQNEISGQEESAPKLTVKTVNENDQTKTYVYKFEVRGLPYDNGVSYRVTEQKVDHYNEPIYKAGVVDTPGGALDGGAIVNIAEESYRLPESGGIGTMVFYVIGGAVLALGAGVLLWRRRRAVVSH